MKPFGAGGAILATYNIHKFVGRDSRRDPERTFQVLRELDADVIGIQNFIRAAIATEQRSRWRI